MAQVLEAHGHHVVGTDLVDRGYGEAGRDFRAETRLPEGITAIVTNPPYGRRLFALSNRAPTVNLFLQSRYTPWLLWRDLAAAER